MGLGAISCCGVPPGACGGGAGEFCVARGAMVGGLLKSPALSPGQGGLRNGTCLIACPPHVLRELVTALRVPKLWVWLLLLNMDGAWELVPDAAPCAGAA